MNPNDMDKGIDDLGGLLKSKLDRLDKAAKGLSPAHGKVLLEMSKTIRDGVATGDMDTILKMAEKVATLNKNNGN